MIKVYPLGKENTLDFQPPLFIPWPVSFNCEKSVPVFCQHPTFLLIWINHACHSESEESAWSAKKKFKLCKTFKRKICENKEAKQNQVYETLVLTKKRKPTVGAPTLTTRMVFEFCIICQTVDSMSVCKYCDMSE